MSARRAVLLVHDEQSGPRLLAEALRVAGFSLHTRYQTLHARDEEAELVVSLGGAMAVYEASHYPFLHAELKLLQKRLAHGRPCLGICLGAQLIAAAAGARVYPGEHGRELGVAPVQLTATAAEDPIFGKLPASFAAPHWHQDTFDDVPGATLLASSRLYRQQAFRLGASYGIQFHAEVGAAQLLTWFDGDLDEVRQALPDAASRERAVTELGSSGHAIATLLDGLALHFAQSASR